MKRKIKFMNYSGETQFLADTNFSQALLSHVIYTNLKDTPSINVFWIDKENEDSCTISIPPSLSKNSSKINLIEKAKSSDEPYSGAFNCLQIKLNGSFKSDKSELSFEIEVKE